MNLTSVVVKVLFHENYKCISIVHNLISFFVNALVKHYLTVGLNDKYSVNQPHDQMLNTIPVHDDWE